MGPFFQCQEDDSTLNEIMDFKSDSFKKSFNSESPSQNQNEL